MQARGRRRNRSAHLRENGLIPLQIVRVTLTRDIWRKRQYSSFKKIQFLVNGNDSFAAVADFIDPQNRPIDRRRIAYPHFTARFDQTFPLPRSQTFQKKKLNLAIIGKSPGGHHARIV